MRIFIAGMDGYLGWALAQHLAARGHEVAGADAFLRREWVEEMGSWSATPIAGMPERLEAFEAQYGVRPAFWKGDLRDYGVVEDIFRKFEPEAVVHLGECPSGPYSMVDRDHTIFVQMNNLISTFNLLFAIRDLSPDTHLLKLGTMGEYGTPNVDIPEGFFDLEYRGRKDRLPFPRQAGSWYHWSKVHGSNNIMFACKIWGIRATDVMQGVVFGTHIDDMGEDERLLTRLDFDQAFGTAINRFCCQAIIGHPLTPYGTGGMRRGFLPLRDSMQCITLGVEHPAEHGEYRVYNQFEETYTISELSKKVREVATGLGIETEIRNVENPRHELQEHHYAPDHEHLLTMGYQPSHDVEAEIRDLIQGLMRHRDRIQAKRHLLLPDVRWDGRRERVAFLGHEKPAAV